MQIKSNIEKAEDEILNPLNDILSIAYDTREYDNIYKEIERLVNVLEYRGLIHPRKKK